MVATRVIADTGSFYSARGIGSQASVGAAVHEERWAGKTHLTNCSGIEMVLCDLYLKRFDLTKGLLFDTFVITVWYKLCRCDHLSIGVQIIFTTNAGSRTNSRTAFHKINREISFRRLLDLQILLRS